MIAFDMGDEVANMVANLLVLIVDGKGAQDPMEVRFPISLVAAHGSTKGNDRFRTSGAPARPDLHPQAVRDTLALTGRLHSAFFFSIAAPYVAPLADPAGSASVAAARVPVL